MEVVGQCPGDKRKHSDVLSAEAHNLATLVPSESDDGEQLDEKKKRDNQDRHTEAMFRECHTNSPRRPDAVTLMAARQLLVDPLLNVVQWG